MVKGLGFLVFRFGVQGLGWCRACGKKMVVQDVDYKRCFGVPGCSYVYYCTDTHTHICICIFVCVYIYI